MDHEISDYEIEILYKVFDSDNSGVISLDEFMKVNSTKILNLNLK